MHDNSDSDDGIGNGNDTHENKIETDGGAVAQMPTATATDSPTIEAGERYSESPEERMALLESEEAESFSTLMHFCMQSRAGKKPRRRLLAAAIGMDGPTYDELETATGRSRRQIRKYLGELEELEIIATQGQGNTTHVLFPDWKMEVLAKRALTLTDY